MCWYCGTGSEGRWRPLFPRPRVEASRHSPRSASVRNVGLGATLNGDEPALAWPPGIRPGTVLDGKYRLERMIGSGGMGLVVEATHVLLRQRVAVKFPRADLLKRSGAKKRFLREARASFALRGEHVVRILDFGVAAPDSPFIVMEYLEGKAVSQLLAPGETLGYAEAGALLVQAMRGVETVHTAGLVHRDLKPSNLFAVRSPDGWITIKVLDFGVATLPQNSNESAITQSGALLGSIAYMSPEQLRAETVDARSDVWALGVILYELLSGRRPFVAPSDAAVIAKILIDPPVPLDTTAAVPPEIAAIVLRCLSKDPNERYQTVERLRHALSEHIPGETLSWQPGARPRSIDVPEIAASAGAFSTLASVLQEREPSAISRAGWQRFIAAAGLLLSVVGVTLSLRGLASDAAPPAGVQQPATSTPTAPAIERTALAPEAPATSPSVTQPRTAAIVRSTTSKRANPRIPLASRTSRGVEPAATVDPATAPNTAPASPVAPLSTASEPDPDPLADPH